MAPLGPIALEQLGYVLSLAIAGLGLFATFRRDSRAERDRDAKDAATQQAMYEHMATIRDMLRETRDTVREISRQITDHSEQLAQMRAQISEHDRRLAALERHRDLRCGAGGTD